MKIITILSNKGGSGKTTATLNLACAATLAKPRHRRKTAIIDLDPQASASDWYDHRELSEPEVYSIQPKRLEKTLKKTKAAGVELVFIDTPPNTESPALAAARAANFVLVPCRPSTLDLLALSATVDALTLAKRHKRAAVVINAAPPRGVQILRRTHDALAAYKLAIAPVPLTQRAAFQHSVALGLAAMEYEPQGKAAQEVGQLYAWLRKRVQL